MLNTIIVRCFHCSKYTTFNCFYALMYKIPLCKNCRKHEKNKIDLS